MAASNLLKHTSQVIKIRFDTAFAAPGLHLTTVPCAAKGAMRFPGMSARRIYRDRLIALFEPNRQYNVALYGDVLLNGAIRKHLISRKTPLWVKFWHQTLQDKGAMNTLLPCKKQKSKFSSRH
eukprot:scaffold129271_cov26-Tisochrysis_lutea.AAC.1